MYDHFRPVFPLKKYKGVPWKFCTSPEPGAGFHFNDFFVRMIFMEDSISI